MHVEASTTGPVTDGWLLQAEQAALGASKTVMSEEDRKTAMTSEPKVLKQDGDTLYIGFDKGCAARVSALLQHEAGH